MFVKTRKTGEKDYKKTPYLNDLFDSAFWWGKGNMSKNVKSVALSIAGIMIAAPAGAEIASTDYVDRIIGETHIQGSVLQFDKLTDDPAFILGATGSGVSNYGAVSIAELGLTLGSQIAGSAITGFATGSGSFVLVGDGTTTGTAGWSSVTEMLRNGLDNPPSTDASSVPVHYNGKNRILYRTPKDFVADMVPGSLISGYETGTGSFVLVGDGTKTGTAKWSTIPQMLMDSPQYSGTGRFNFIGFDDDNNTLIGMSSGAFRGYFMGDVGSYIKGYGTGTGAYVLVGDGTTTGSAKWQGMSTIGSGIAGYGTGTGSYVLVGNTTTGAAKWSSVTEMLRNGLANTPPTGDFSVPVHQPGKNTFQYLPPTSFTAQMIKGSWINGYETGTGSYVLVSNITSGTAHYMGASNLSQYMRGSAISGYNTVTGQPSYILGSSASGTGAKPALYPMSGLGSKIEFTETKTAEQLSASTGTIYFPVIQGGKIYGVTLNDFYILMNAQF